ncbi:MAG TPA: hypothetical protein VJM31_09645 [Vicinamibacterales bacterium]|nr:hypothetical protein [Vicinamibacterales bacterium]
MTRVRYRLVGGIAFLVVGATVAFSASQHYLPKYASDGTLVDSAVSEIGGLVYMQRDHTSTATPVEVLRLTRKTTGSAEPGIGAQVAFEVERAGGSVSAAAAIDGVWLNVAGGNEDGALIFRTSDDGNTPVERVRVDNLGNVGIGTTSPADKLHVAGSIKVDGNIAAKYQDVAEWVETNEAIEPGTVVSTDRTSTNRVRPSSKAYDTAVAGVVSQQPGIILGERGTGKVAVTQSGRVRVKVDARYGAIQPGDLLVASPTEGHAMRSEAIVVGDTSIHRPGTIVGKALQAWTSGRGDVLVLVTLQ